MPTTDRPIALHHLPRRRFALLLPLGGMALLAACSKSPEPAATPAPAPAPTPAPAPAAEMPAATAPAQAGAGTAGLPMVDPADPSVKALDYTADASQAAPSHPKFQPGQACSNCALYAGQPGDAAGPCPLYPGRQVSAKAWCNAYAKKA